MKPFTLLVTPFVLALLTACGGDGNGNVAPDALTPINPEPPVTGSSTNASGNLTIPVGFSAQQGNPVIDVLAENNDGIAKVSLRFSDDGSEHELCSSQSTCGVDYFEDRVSGVNPGMYGAEPGSINVSLVVTDSLGQSDVVDTLSLNWQPPQITGVTGARQNNDSEIQISWALNPNILRYNLYLASQSGVNQYSYQQLPDGQALLAVESPPQVFTGLDPFVSYYVLLAGVDGSGESTFMDELVFPARNVTPNNPPVANNDAAQTDEDQAVLIDVLQNDSDSDGDPLTIVDASASAGIAEIQSGGILFTPALNEHGTATLTYMISDGNGGTASASVNVTILPVNDNPDAVDDSFTSDEDELTELDVLQNDTDADGDSLTITSVSANEGTSDIQNGLVVYEPPVNFNGEVILDYIISDGQGGVGNATVILDVLPVNDEPVAVDDSATTEQDISVNIDVLANDTDVDGDPIVIDSVSNGLGNVTIESDNTLTYVPQSGYIGADSFSYDITDGNGGFSTAQVIVTIGAASRAPIANNDEYIALENQLLTVLPAQGVMVNDADPDGDSIVVDTTPVTDVSFGTLVLVSDGSFTYQPNTNFTGTDSFVYQITDSTGLTQSAFVSIEVPSIPANLSGQSSSITGDLFYMGLGETSSGNGVGSGRYRIGECLQEIHTVCVMRGQYAESSTSGKTPNESGTYAFVQKYQGVGDSPVIAISETPGSNNLNFIDVGGAVFELYLFPDNGGRYSLLYPDNPIGDSLNFGAFITSFQFCNGLPAGVPCSIGEVGLYPGADLTGQLDRIEFTQAGEALVKDRNGSPRAEMDSYSTAVDTPLVISAPGFVDNDSDPNTAIFGDSLETILQFSPSIGGLASVGLDEFRQYVYTTSFTGSFIAINNAIGSSMGSISLPFSNSGNIDIEVAPEALQIAGNTVPQGTVLVINGGSGPATIYALDITTGTTLATLNTAVGNGDVVGGAYNPISKTFFLLQQSQTSSGEPIVSEVDPLSGAILTQITGVFTDLQFYVTHGDLDVNNQTGTFYVLSSTESRLLELNKDGNHLRTLPLPSSLSVLSGLAVNINSDEVWVSSNDGNVYQLLFQNKGVLPFLTAEIVVPPLYGTLDASRDGAFTYTPDSGFIGDDIFTYQITDDKGKTSLANVLISVTN
ncbi:Ig-like domain-containing protein [Alteromonas facilis]|uniref:Ig-like domain-containing protein n=1 Tax=Alteromonas facilis TaxID=2048004 RepID=UPI000C2938E6|nr:Ig-like domain-containing protein [Alteromonas facilis]